MSHQHIVVKSEDTVQDHQTISPSPLPSLPPPQYTSQHVQARETQDDLECPPSAKRQDVGTTYFDVENDAGTPLQPQLAHSTLVSNQSVANTSQNTCSEQNRIYEFGSGVAPPRNEIVANSTSPQDIFVGRNQTMEDLMENPAAVFVRTDRPRAFLDALLALQINLGGKSRSGPTEEVCLVFRDGGIRLKLISNSPSLKVTAMVKRSSFTIFRMPTSVEVPFVAITVKLSDLILATRVFESEGEIELALHALGGNLKIRTLKRESASYVNVYEKVEIPCSTECDLLPLVNRDVEIADETAATNQAILSYGTVVGRMFAVPKVLNAAFHEICSIPQCKEVRIRINKDFLDPSSKPSKPTTIIPIQEQNAIQMSDSSISSQTNNSTRQNENEEAFPQALIILEADDNARIRRKIQFPASLRSLEEYTQKLLKAQDNYHQSVVTANEPQSVVVDPIVRSYAEFPYAIPTPGKIFKRPLTNHSVITNTSFVYARQNLVACTSSMASSTTPVEMVFYSSGICRFFVRIDVSAQNYYKMRQNLEERRSNPDSMSDYNWVEYVLWATESAEH